VLAGSPGHPTALHLLGVLTLATGRATESLDLLTQAMEERGHNEETRLAYAGALAATGRTAAAIGLYEATLVDNPRHVGALVNLANARRDAGDAKGAIQASRQALAIAPRLVQAHVTLGSALLAAGQTARAIGAYRAAVTLRADFAPAQIGLAMALLRDNRIDAAVGTAGRAVNLAPDNVEAWFVRGAALRAQGAFEEAVAALERATALDPRHARAHLTLGNALADLDRLGEAELHLRWSIAVDPTLPEAHVSLGFLLTGNGRFADAVAACDAAIALRPDFARAFWNRSFAHMLSGNYARGWEDYEWRRRHDQYAAGLPPLPGPEWAGEDLAGKTILVHAEQGLGDTIQFARYLPLLAERGATVILACARALMKLMLRLPGVSAVVGRSALPAYDVWVNQMSLPRLFATRVDSIPAAAGYLTADPALAASWRQAAAHRPRVGIVWAGNPAHSNDSRRSMPAALLAPILAVDGIDWVSLQVGPTSHQIGTRYGIPDVSARLTDFDQTAALIATLDLVIAVDTATAHLAGAMGKPVWLLLPYAPDWRWLPGREDSPWYASARLFRQPAPGDWLAVIQDVALALLAVYPARVSSETPSIPSVAEAPLTTVPHTMSTSATSEEKPLSVARLVMS
jgi:tetratricopeptide (TPR) repeat protein